LLILATHLSLKGPRGTKVPTLYFIHDPIWPSPLTLWPWIPNQFTYPSWWVTKSRLMKIHQLTREISSPQDFHSWPHLTLTFDPMTKNTKSVQLPFMVSNHVKFDEDPSTHYRDIAPTRLQRQTDGCMDRQMHGRQTKNIMPPATTYGGWRHNYIQYLTQNVLCSWWVTMLSLMKIHQLTTEISRLQGYKDRLTDAWTDKRTDGQTKNIMPPATTYGGWRHNYIQYLTQNVLCYRNT